MIKYLLKCKNKHEFESWFSSSMEYEKLKKEKIIECIFCKSQEVSKSIMSPNIARKKNKINNMFDHQEFIKIKKELKEIKKYVNKNFKFVGENFPKEVRKIYYDKNKNNNIYGTVSEEEKAELKEEGIQLTSIPWIEDKNN